MTIIKIMEVGGWILGGLFLLFYLVCGIAEFRTSSRGTCTWCGREFTYRGVSSTAERFCSMKCAAERNRHFPSTRDDSDYSAYGGPADYDH